MLFFETIATALLLAITLLPWAVYGLRNQGGVRRLLAYSVLCVLGTTLLWAVSLFQSTDARDLRVDHRPLEVPDAGYVTSDTCRACHPHYHATWHGSYHSKMTQIASAKSVAGPFDGVELNLHGDRYRLTKQEDDFFVDIHRGDVTTRWPVVMTTGSHHRQWVWMATGDSRKLQALPFLYLIHEQRWTPTSSSFLVPPNTPISASEGEWNRNCIQCHTTQGRMRRRRAGPNEFAMDSYVSEFGIACEACHGPAEKHVRANRDPLRRHRLRTTGQPDPTIVNPARLPAHLSSQVCGQCHAALSLFKSPHQAPQWNNDGFAYRPGQDLRDTRHLFGYEPHMETPIVRSFVKANPTYLEYRFWSDGVVRVAGREFSGLLSTPCYNHGDESKQMSCLSCHVMHQPANDTRTLSAWANDQLKADMNGNRACTQCHDEFTSTTQLEAHTHHPASSSGSHCFNCHMPYTTFGLLKAIRSHAIVSPDVQSSLDTGRPNACNQCHLDRTLDWTADYLESWHGTSRPNLSDDERQIAASVLWALKGDAAQRALMAWSMGVGRRSPRVR